MKKLVRGFLRFIVFSDGKFAKISEQLISEEKILLDIWEMWNLYCMVKKTARLSGGIAELGVFSGGSAKLICEAKGSKKLYLFDTFSGVPRNKVSLNKIDEGKIKGDSLSKVKNYLKNYSNVYFYEGVFPASAVGLKDRLRSISLLHLDADIYEATIDGLKYFYPLMSKKGMIIIHDYKTEHLPGVKKAVNEFLKDKPEKIIELWKSGITRFYPTSQAMIIKQ